MNLRQALTAVRPAVPFTNEELRSWAIRKLPEWNFTRLDVSASLTSGLSSSSASQALLPPAYRANIAAAILRIAEPTTFDPSSWGVSPVDLYHMHVFVPKPTATTADSDLNRAEDAFFRRRNALRRQAADGSSTIVTPAQATKYKMLLQGMTADYRRHLEAAAQRPGVRLEYHSFEHDRPTGIQPDDPHRSWRSLTLNSAVPISSRRSSTRHRLRSARCATSAASPRQQGEPRGARRAGIRPRGHRDRRGPGGRSDMGARARTRGGK
jgi:hypothetical protein